MAWSVGMISKVIFLVLAWNFTSFITGSDPYLPVPIISRRHFQGIFSPLESGVCPNSSRNFRDGFFLRLRTSYVCEPCRDR